MIEMLLPLVPDYGVGLMLIATFLSCLALPIPASLLMVTGGAFAASGDLALVQVAGAALLGAVSGDQLGYLLGRIGGSAFLQRVGTNATRASLVDKASSRLADKGAGAVFLSRWLFSPLGPWVNLAAGTLGLPWLTFTLAGVAGEALWVSVYVGPGYLFASNISTLTETIGSLMGLLAAGALALGLGYWLLRSGVADKPGEEVTVA